MAINEDEARNRFKAIKTECDRGGLRYWPINVHVDGLSSKELRQRVFDNAAFAADIQQSLGTIYAHAEAGLIAMDPSPAPPPPAPAKWVAPVSNGGVFGTTKWLPNSLGCDVFLVRGTPVVAPMDCVVEEIIGGFGMNGGAEMIVTSTDRQYSWRFRHVQAQGMVVGQTVRQNMTLAVVSDDSLDKLGAIPQWATNLVGPFPDGWQHLDVSFNQGTNQFSPQGGGGGNRSAYQWLVQVGYQGKLMARTPGPPDAGWGEERSDFITGNPDRRDKHFHIGKYEEDEKIKLTPKKDDDDKPKKPKRKSKAAKKAAKASDSKSDSKDEPKAAPKNEPVSEKRASIWDEKPSDAKSDKKND